MNATRTVFRIERLLPQTQCRECGYDGCAPYAQAVVDGAPANLCLPGGADAAHDLAKLLGRSYLPPVDGRDVPEQYVVRIRESDCIGCTACIRVCPVDAVLGAKGQMHAVFSEECTGCGLCIPACPTDCIEKFPVPARWLPESRTLAEKAGLTEREGAAAQASTRFQNRNARLQRLAEEKARQAAAYRARFKAQKQEHVPDAPSVSSSLNPAALLAKAAAKAGQMRADIPVSASTDEHYAEARVAAAREKAAFRRANHRLQYGNENEKAEALIFLRQLKAKDNMSG